MPNDSRDSNNTVNTNLTQAPNEPLVFRSPHDSENPFAQISKEMLRDKNLPLRARGLLAFLLSYVNFKIYPRFLAKEFSINIETVYNILNELIEAGYCQRTQISGQKGRFGGMQYEYSESPRFKNKVPQTVLPCTVPPSTVKPVQHNNIPKHKKDSLHKKKEQPAPECMNVPRKPSVVVPSFFEEKKAALSRFCLEPRKLKELMGFELNQIRDAILAFDQFASTNQIENVVGCLTTAIRGAWKPNLDAASVKRIKENLEPHQEAARKRILSQLKPLVEAQSMNLKDGVKIKLTSHMVFLIYPHGQTALQLWNEDAIVMVEYFLETNRKE